MSYLKGEVTYRVYHNDLNMYSVYKVEIEDTDLKELEFYKTCSVTGYFEGLDIGSTFIFKGKLVESKKYGYTFQADTFERVLPASREGVIGFLSGDLFKGIGKAIATDIVDTLGDDCLKDIIKDRRILDQVKGLSEKKKDIIYDVLYENMEVEETLVTLYSYGISPKIAYRIYDTYKEYTLDVIKKEPYRLIKDVEGIAFLKADKIALSTGINLKSESRIEACLEYTLKTYTEETGNTYLSKDELIERTRNFLLFDKSDDERIVQCLTNLTFRGDIIEEDESFSPSSLYYAEKYIARKLRNMDKDKKKPFFSEEIDRLIKTLEESSDIKYEDGQKEAIFSALLNNVSIITGGPGTGKTTIEKGIIYLYHELVERDLSMIYLCAPTGKASKRIEESTGYKAQTIHRTLGYDREGNYSYNKYNPLPAKLVVVDEASMIDTYLFQRLLEALPVDCKIVIVGDSDQLPSIGPGQVLKDLIDSKAFKTTKLTKIHRQKQNSKIISLAYDILDEDITTTIDEEHDELSFIKCEPGELKEVLESTIHHFLGMGYGLENDIQVLIPLYKGQVGIDFINKYLQSALNSKNNFEMNYDSNTYYLDDKVIQLVNQYEDMVMNGDMGVVKDLLSDKEIVVDFQGNVVKYKGQDISNISLAYAISIHKSQGSEFKVVIVPVFNQYNIIMNKKLLYTAVTRAKDHLVLVGNMRSLLNAIKISSKDRATRLPKFL